MWRSTRKARAGAQPSPTSGVGTRCVASHFEGGAVVVGEDAVWGEETDEESQGRDAARPYQRRSCTRPCHGHSDASLTRRARTGFWNM